MKRILLISLVGLFLSGSLSAQDDLLADLVKEDSSTVKQNITIATFKSTRVINMHSVEMTGEGNLQFMIIHHFGAIWDNSEGGANFARLLGMNSGFANTYMSFDYTPVRWLNLGLAWSGNTSMEGTAKFKWMRQQSGQKNYPVSIASVHVARVDASQKLETPNDLYWNRMSFVNQLLIARKFSESISAQLIPSWVHYNIVPYGNQDLHDIFSVGVGGRVKLSAKKALTFEYSRQLNGYDNVIDKTGEIVSYSPNLFSLGYDWDTGGHIFQFFLTNSSYASNIQQLSVNTVKDNFGQWSLGFNLNRSYAIKHKVQTK
ncbi:MAG TPA: DUF5777 family beta-barrel protein [Chitinophagaceae bacterium]|nr:DUF5777 family beta-barrel protein [Chitinophagaceae bacterium]